MTVLDHFMCILSLCKRTRTTKVEHKAPVMCFQENMMSRICLDRPKYRQSKMSRDETKGLLNMADIFLFQFQVTFLCLCHF